MGPGQGDGVGLFVGHALAQGLDAVEHAALAGTLDGDALLVHRDAVGIGVFALEAQGEGHGQPFGLLLIGLRDESQIFACKLGVALHLGVVGGVAYGLSLNQCGGLAALVQLDGLWQGYHLIIHFGQGTHAEGCGGQKKIHFFHDVIVVFVCVMVSSLGVIAIIRRQR